MAAIFERYTWPPYEAPGIGARSGYPGAILRTVIPRHGRLTGGRTESQDLWPTQLSLAPLQQESAHERQDKEEGEEEEEEAEAQWEIGGSSFGQDGWRGVNVVEEEVYPASGAKTAASRARSGRGGRAQAPSTGTVTTPPSATAAAVTSTSATKPVTPGLLTGNWRRRPGSQLKSSAGSRPFADVDAADADADAHAHAHAHMLRLEDAPEAPCPVVTGAGTKSLSSVEVNDNPNRRAHHRLVGVERAGPSSSGSCSGASSGFLTASTAPSTTAAVSASCVSPFLAASTTARSHCDGGKSIWGELERWTRINRQKKLEEPEQRLEQPPQLAGEPSRASLQRLSVHLHQQVQSHLQQPVQHRRGAPAPAPAGSGVIDTGLGAEAGAVAGAVSASAGAGATPLAPKTRPRQRITPPPPPPPPPPCPHPPQPHGPHHPHPPPPPPPPRILSQLETPLLAASPPTPSQLSFVHCSPPAAHQKQNHQVQPQLEKRRHPRLSLPVAMMPDYRHMRSGSLTIPGGVHSNNHSMPRSPPNTSHVPCKFYRQGACQAGTACPFSHDLGAASENICKYFAKRQGNCKFGPKCANIHVLPDGRRVNYGKNGVTIGPTPINLANRSATSHGPANPPSGMGNVPYNQSTTSALTTSFLRTNTSYPYDEKQQVAGGHHPSQQPNLENALPTIDTPYSNSNYGSPREEESARLGFGLSPATGSKGLSVLDAPLPASFDSNGISNAARFPAAPWPSSVPSKFGLESHSPSLGSVKDSRPSETLKLLHTSAFGSSDHLATPTPGSPPTASQQLSGEEYFGRRTMHSSRLSKPRMLSASMPKNTSVDRDWDAEFAFDESDNVPENFVPGDLQELLTPLEKARRGSMRAEQPDMSIDGISKYGSPIGTSPSRWNSLFQRQKEEEEMTRATRGGAGSAFGHVGSPLRNSILVQEANDDFRSSTGVRSSSSIRSGSDAMSALSQQLQRNRLDDAFGSSNSFLHPTNGRSSAYGIGSFPKDRAIERLGSSLSVSSGVLGRHMTPLIDEEDTTFVFNMEEEDEFKVTGSLPNYASRAGNQGAVGSAKEGRDVVPVGEP